jgi:hypothetical protein
MLFVHRLVDAGRVLFLYHVLAWFDMALYGRFSRLQCADKSASPILATQASPGMGKSSLMDAICSLTEAQVRELSPAAATTEFCAEVASSIRIPVDYHGFQAPSVVIDVPYPEIGIALRILHSCVIA